MRQKSKFRGWDGKDKNILNEIYIAEHVINRYNHLKSYCDFYKPFWEWDYLKEDASRNPLEGWWDEVKEFVTTSDNLKLVPKMSIEEREDWIPPVTSDGNGKHCGMCTSTHIQVHKIKKCNFRKETIPKGNSRKLYYIAESVCSHSMGDLQCTLG